ncbi:carbohydrate binding domain-containing protein [Cellulomonas sp.]|uniref:carbohydrate binding domain-containing protein n=1 Tax=Cellulomonas sp. TaxID=40001 RepID=UPI0025B977BC|nr:carbohydrate binding domain-containing protein [Cellulomonas sp.]
MTKSGNQLMLGGTRFRFGGGNEYWLGLDENVGGVNPADPPTVDLPTYFRIRDGLTTARVMGSRVVRAHTLGVDLGSPNSLEPVLGQFNNDAFASIDYAVAESGRLGLKLLVPLTDNWDYYHGGKYTFLRWLGVSTTDNGAAFFTDPTVRVAFKQYISAVLTHVNPYTGKRYVDDPTVMAWELGNELNGMTPEWVNDISSYISQLAPKQLVAAGGQSGTGTSVLQSPDVDIVDVHYYPPTAAKIATDAAAAKAAGKVYIAGEYSSAAASHTLLDAVAANQDVDGALFWSLFPHGDHYGFAQHSDGFTVHYPGDTPAMRTAVSAITRFAGLMGTCTGCVKAVGDAPLLTSVVKTEGVNLLTWRGTAGAWSYRVERATGRSWSVIGTGIADSDTPWLDSNTPTSAAQYRVVALNASGAALAVSAPLGVGSTEDAVTDPLEDWFVASQHSANLQRIPTDQGVQVSPNEGKQATLTYVRAGITSVAVTVASPRGRADIRLQVSADGATKWKTVKPRTIDAGRDAVTLSLSEMSDVGGVRVEWPSGSRAAVTRVSNTSAAGSLASAIPGPFAVTAPPAAATGVSTATSISWSASAHAAYYSVLVSKNADLSSPVVQAASLRTTSYRPSVPLDASTTYYVQVQAVNADGTTTATGPPASFTTRSPVAGVLVDDFDGYASDAALQTAYVRNVGGDPIASTLSGVADGFGSSMLLTYALGSNGYAGVTHAIAQNWSSSGGLRMWLQPDGTARNVTVQFVTSTGYWEKSISPTGTDAQFITIPFNQFKPPSWASQGATLDLTSVSQISFYLGGSTGSGTLQVDSITAYPAP